jgi:hypothetical protein
MNVLVNQQVYVVPTETRDGAFYATILKIGPKYITVSNMHRSVNRFYVSDLRNIEDRYKLYLSKDAFDIERANSELKSRVFIYVRDNLHILNFESLNEVKTIIDRIKNINAK